MRLIRTRYVNLQMRYFRKYSRQICIEDEDIPILCRIAADSYRDGLCIPVIKGLLRIDLLKRHTNDIQDTKKLESMLLSPDIELNNLALSIIQGIENKKLIS